jgi:hypothetical protein
MQFRLADLMYRRGQLSKRIIDDLLDLWALDNLGKEPPFTDHQDLYNVLDAIQVGDAPWQTFNISYDGERPMENVPSWMDQKFEVWHRDPHQVMRELLGNPEFADGFAYTPYQQFENDERRWTDFMSGNWAWRQAVTVLRFHSIQLFD